MSLTDPSWIVDPDDPRAPPNEVWAKLTEGQRTAVVAALPPSLPEHMQTLPEGDWHRDACGRTSFSLERYFDRTGRNAYVGVGNCVYYPGKRAFAPDVFVVLDVSPHRRMSWIVAQEGGKGLDVAIEVHHHGKRAKDLERNPDLYFELGIPEYFAYDVGRQRLYGWRSNGARYERIMPQSGLLTSAVLGLSLTVRGDRLRLMLADMDLPDHYDLIDRLSTAVDSAARHAEQEATRADEEASRADEEASRAEREAMRAEEEARRADEETRRAQELAQRVRELEAKLAEVDRS